MAFVWVCVGGAFGSGLRYLLSLWAVARFGPGFPWGTLMVNVLGSFALAWILGRTMTEDAMNPSLKLALTTGVMGGFTTFSTFSFEAMRLIQRGDGRLAAGYVIGTVALGLGACFAGFALARIGANG